MSILSQKKISISLFFSFFRYYFTAIFSLFLFRDFLCEDLGFIKINQSNQNDEFEKKPRIFSGFCHGCTPFMNACIYSIYGCKYCYYTFRVMARPFSKKCVFYQFTKTRNLWSYSKIACFINLLKDCVGQAFFAKVLGGITQF